MTPARASPQVAVKNVETALAALRSAEGRVALDVAQDSLTIDGPGKGCLVS